MLAVRATTAYQINETFDLLHYLVFFKDLLLDLLVNVIRHIETIKVDNFLRFHLGQRNRFIYPIAAHAAIIFEVPN